MDYDKLIERLKSAAGGPEGIKMCQDAALAIKALRADLARVTAERDGAVEAVKTWLNTSSAPGVLTIICAMKYPKSTT